MWIKEKTQSYFESELAWSRELQLGVCVVILYTVYQDLPPLLSFKQEQTSFSSQSLPKLQFEHS